LEIVACHKTSRFQRPQPSAIGLIPNRCEQVDQASGQISAEVPDWTRERPRQFWDPGRRLLLTVRRYQFWQARGGLFGKFCCKFVVLRHRFWSVVTGAEIPLTCQVGGGLLIPHPNGIVIHADAKIGVNCLIFHQVTLGSRGRGGVPEIGGHVDIGAGAKILGPVKIGAHARIGANAVVICRRRAIRGGDRVSRRNSPRSAIRSKWNSLIVKAADGDRELVTAKQKVTLLANAPN
jgi:serine O-acetyltransferase